MDFIDILNSAWFRIMLILSILFVKLADNYQADIKRNILIFGICIAIIYFIIFFISYVISDKERLFYNSLIYRGYIHNSQENKNENWIFVDQIILSVLYLSIYFGLYILKTDNNAINSGLLKISLGMILISLFAKFFIPPLLIDSSWGVLSFNTIQSYVYSSIIGFIVLIASPIYYMITINNVSQIVILQNIFTILIVITSIYLILSPLINKFNDIECKYFTNEENCNLKSSKCTYKNNECIEFSSSSESCSSYNDESSCNNVKNCYYVKNIDDISDLTSDQFNECINIDEKCTGKYKSSCSSTFEPTNRFKECCYDTIFDGSDCIKSEYEKRENQSVNNYSKESYISAKGYCSEMYERKDIEAGIYA